MEVEFWSGGGDDLGQFEASIAMPEPIALTYVGGSVLGPAVVTSEFKINYVRPAMGDYIVARATAIYIGKTQAVCRCDVFAVKDAKESLCATAQGTITKIGQSK